MKEWQNRVHEERDELLFKMQKLQHFIATVKDMDIIQMNLLRDQHDVMQQYVNILDKRMAQWLR